MEFRFDKEVLQVQVRREKKPCDVLECSETCNLFVNSVSSFLLGPLTSRHCLTFTTCPSLSIFKFCVKLLFEYLLVKKQQHCLFI